MTSSTATTAHGSSAEPGVRIDDVSKRYGRTLALDGVSLTAGPNELFALLGPNGAGKTTLIHILCTLLKPDSGTASLAGKDVLRQPLQARKQLGVVFQEPSLDDRLTVYENLNFHGLVYQVPLALRRKRIVEMLELVELTGWSDRPVKTLSSGMKRRVELARALIHDCSVLFLDEPTVGLDAQSRERIWSYLHDLRKRRSLTVIVTTHYIEEVEGCDRVCIIDHGKVLAMGSPESLKASHGREFIRVRARDAAAAAAIRERFPDAFTNSEGEILIPGGTAATTDAFLAAFGARVSQIAFDRPSLESVFLTLTGRELRDQQASRRERTYAFGRRGGEQTR